jgi:hypothetical protein
MPITITATPAVVVAGRAANTFGIGEVIDFTAAVNPAPPRTPVFRWDLSEGADRGHFSSDGNRARLTIFSLSDGTITVRVKNAFDDTQATLTLNIVAPNECSLAQPHVVFHRQGYAEAGFKSRLRLRNRFNVSFNNLELREGNAPPIRTGRYLTDNRNPANHPATFGLQANWIRVGDAMTDVALQNAVGPGYIGIATDSVRSIDWQPPFTQDGTFEWRIPWTYRVRVPNPVDVRNTPINLPDRGDRQCNNVITHSEVLVGNRMTIRKGGQFANFAATDPDRGIGQW